MTGSYKTNAMADDSQPQNARDGGWQAAAKPTGWGMAGECKTSGMADGIQLQNPRDGGWKTAANTTGWQMAGSCKTHSGVFPSSPGVPPPPSMQLCRPRDPNKSCTCATPGPPQQDGRRAVATPGPQLS